MRALSHHVITHSELGRPQRLNSANHCGYDNKILTGELFFPVLDAEQDIKGGYRQTFTMNGAGRKSRDGERTGQGAYIHVTLGCLQ